jgi:photosystem II stability/assembly factor-like uncharacterized protein
MTTYLARAARSAALALVPAALAAQNPRTQPTPPPRADSSRAADTTRARVTDDTASSGPSLNGFRLRSIGPGMISGRISDLAVHPRDKKTWYIGVAAGGVWKTTNAGTTWTPVFDQQSVYSIGTVVIDPKNPNVVWVGTGENNAQRAVAYGDGIYKSVDAGRTWQNVGLRESEHIGKIVIDPRNSDVVYVAAQGPLSVKGGDRGLFKTTDGGRTWKKVLDGGTWAGVSDVVLDPRNPDVLIATTWQRVRRTYGYIAGGPESGVWRSTDGGATWRRSQSGLPADELGRIGLGMSPVNPDVVYAMFEAGRTGDGAAGAAGGRGGFYRFELGAHEQLQHHGSLLQRDVPRPGERRSRIRRGRPQPGDGGWRPHLPRRRRARQTCRQPRHLDRSRRRRPSAHRLRRRLVRVVRPRADVQVVRQSAARAVLSRGRRQRDSFL